jgi:glycosyltransferase involved in cell wall biosynthesis
MIENDLCIAARQSMGWLTDDARAAALCEADLLLVPSVWPEPFGLVGVEAATAGLPSIAFDVGGIRDWLSDGVNGRLVDLGGDRVRRYAGAIVSTLSDGAALQRMKEDAVQLAQRFTMATHVAALEPILQKTATRARPAVSISQTA